MKLSSINGRLKVISILIEIYMNWMGEIYMDEIVKYFGVFSGIVTIIAIAVSIEVVWVSNSVGQKTLYAKTVSENRVKWLYILRNMIYKFIKLSREDETSDKELTNIKNEIQLYYNISEQKTLISLLDKIIADKNDEKLKEQLIKYCQFTFKSEWEKVKKEAGKPSPEGFLKKIKNKIIRNCYKYLWIWLGCTFILIFAFLMFRFNQLSEQRITIRFLSAMNTNDNFNIMKDIIIPIILSIIAAIIFWLIFNHFPTRNRYLKLRPKLEYSMFNVYSELFHYIDLTLIHNNFSPSMFQDEIRAGSLKKEDFILGLQNKCLNDSYLYDANSKLFIVVGDYLFNESIKIDTEIERIFSFNDFLGANEILLLEKIRTLLFTYNYKGIAYMKIGNQTFTPSNPNLSYMADNIYEIYKLFLQLQDIIFSNKYFSREIMLYSVQYLYFSQNYKKCINQIEKNIENYQDCRILLECYDFLCNYNLNRKEDAYEKIERLFNNKLDLVSYRNFIITIIKDDIVQDLLKQYYSKVDIESLNKVIEKENQKTNFINQAKMLQEYYNNKQI